jgi:hypothetical protein
MKHGMLPHELTLDVRLRKRLLWWILSVLLAAAIELTTAPSGLQFIMFLIPVVSVAIVLSYYHKYLATRGIYWTWRHDMFMFAFAIGTAICRTIVALLLCIFPLSIFNCNIEFSRTLFIDILNMAGFYAIAFWPIARREWRKINSIVNGKEHK